MTAWSDSDEVGTPAAVGDIALMQFHNDRYFYAGLVTEIHPNGRVRTMRAGGVDFNDIGAVQCVLIEQDTLRTPGLDFAAAVELLANRRTPRFKSLDSARRFFMKAHKR